MNVVIDLETANNTPNAAILSIGAAALGEKNLAIEATFYTAIKLQSCIARGLTMGVSTISWCMEQAPEARVVWEESAADKTPTLQEALVLFQDWLKTVDARYNAKVWGNGSDFDNVILANAYSACEMEVPWRFWNNRCFRTVKQEWRRMVAEPDFMGTRHNAKDDAVHEARWLARILQEQDRAMTALCIID